MADYPVLIPPAAGATIGSPAELEGLVSNATPNTYVGMVWDHTVAPNVASYPMLAFWVWIDRSGPRPIKRVYDSGTGTWIQELPDDASITNDMLVGDIDVSKLAPGTDGYVIRTVSGNVVFDSPVNLFSAAPGGFRMPVTAISLPASAGSWVATSDGTTTGWTLAATLFSTLDVALAQIDPSGALDKQVIAYVAPNITYTYVESLLRDNQTPIIKVAAPGNNLIYGTNGLGVSVALTPTEVSALIKPTTVKKYTSAGTDAIPAKAGLLTLAHGLGVKPDVLEVRLIAVAADAGYAIGDDPLLTSFSNNGGAGDDVSSIFSVYSDTSSVYLCRDAEAALDINVRHKSTGVAKAITEASWKVKVTAIYFP